MAFFEIIKKTPAEWTAANPILLDNEIGVEEDVRNNANTVPAKAKMGDNVTRWNDLEYWNPPGVADVPWTSASASSSASLAFAEDTDNGAHAVTLKAPAAVTADIDVTLPDAAGTLALDNGVKVYRALLTQTGTDAPTATVLENTLGGTVVWTYNSPGNYTATLAGAFPFTKTILHLENYNWDGAIDNSLKRVGDNTLILNIAAGDDFLGADVPGMVAICVYP